MYEKNKLSFENKKFKDETYNTYNILCIISILYSTCIFMDELFNHTTFRRT